VNPPVHWDEKITNEESGGAFMFIKISHYPISILVFAVGKASALRLSVPALFPARTELRVINLFPSSLLPSPPLSLLPTPYSLLPNL
jgi:hypothetical protein